MATEQLRDLGNGIGWLYIMAPDGTSFIASIPNLSSEVPRVLQDATFRAPVAGRVAAQGSVTVVQAVSGGADTVTDITVDGVNQIAGNPATIVNGDPAATAINMRDSVNGTVPASGVDYTASVDGATVYLHSSLTAGDTVNGDVVAVLFTGASNMTTENVAGGSNGDGIFDPNFGHRYFINANYDASGNPSGPTAGQGDLTNAIEITKDIIQRGLQTKIEEETVVVSGDQTSFSRLTAVQSLTLDTSGGTEDLETIVVGDSNIGDRITLRGTSLAKAVTVQEGGNIYLGQALPFVANETSACIEFELKDGDNGVAWYEVSRSIGAVTTASLRLDGIPQGVAGVKDIAVLAAGTTVNLVPGTDEAEVKVTSAPAVTLVGNVTITLDATGAISGDHFKIRYQADLTLGGNTITIGGINVPDYQATGGYNFDFVYNSTGGWSGEAYPDLTDAGTTKLDGQKINPGSVNVDELATDLKVASSHVRVTFEAGEQGEYRYYPGFKCDVTLVTSRVELALAAVDAGTITFANNTGNMAGGVVTHALSAAFGDEQTITPSSNTEILATEPIKITTAKTTAGGKVGLSIKLVRKE